MTSTTRAPAPPTRARGRRRLLSRLALVVLVVVALFYAAGGWYFSGLIRGDGLEVAPYPVVQDLALTPADDGTVTVRTQNEDELRMLTGPTTYGVEWAGGYGQVSGPVVSSTAGSVVRRFETLVGTAPEEDTPASLELGAFPDDPTLSLGPTATEVRYTSDVGSFPAWFVPGTGPDPTTWAVLVHGKGGTRTEMYRMALSTVARGLPTLDITYRNDEGLPRDPSGYYQYGRTEWRDLAAAVAHAREQGAERVVLGGDSMGGGIIAAYLRHRAPGRDEPPVAGLVLDAPMLDFATTVRFGAQQLALPIPGAVRESLASVALRIAAIRFGVDWETVDYLEDSDWLTVPTVVFHGTADTTVPISTSRELAAAHPDLVTLEVRRGVEHVRSWNADPDAYDAAISALLDRR